MANPNVALTELLMVGVECVFESDSEDNSHGVVFEDDGSTGYFYARDYSIPDQLFVDALHIYSAEGVTDRDVESNLSIIWSNDWRYAALIINQYPHAAFDFKEKTGYSRDNFPEADPKTGWTHHPWDDSIRSQFYPSPNGPTCQQHDTRPTLERLNTMRFIFAVLLMLTMTSSLVTAQEKSEENRAADTLDQVVAAGIALKFEFFLDHVNKSGVDAELFQQILETINHDAKSFSQTVSGNRQREAARRLILFVKLVYTGEPSSKNKKFIALLK